MKFTKILIAMTVFLSAIVKAEVMVENPYVRAMPPGQSVTGAFMILENKGSDTRSVVAAKSPAAGIVELHTHIDENGMMMMRQVEKIDVPAGASTELKPGGLHVMLIDVPNQLKVGDVVDITLVFDDESTQSIKAPVKSVTGGMMKKGMSHGDMHDAAKKMKPN